MPANSFPALRTASAMEKVSDFLATQGKIDRKMGEVANTAVYIALSALEDGISRYGSLCTECGSVSPVGTTSCACAVPVEERSLLIEFPAPGKNGWGAQAVGSWAHERR